MQIRTHLTLFLLLFFLGTAFSQTANVTKGCSPLKVSFSAPDLSSYYWDFVEGNASSTSQNPEHIFTHPGTYTVTLFEGENGTKIGEIEIKVYPEPEIKIIADTLNGCAPLKVNFTAEITLDPELSIESYLWAFGDGNTSSNANPSHNYTVKGSFNVSLEITTDLVECTTLFTEKNMITTDLIESDFSVDDSAFCDAPATVKFTNESTLGSGLNYFWDFGNGISSIESNPDSITYNQEGVFTVSLTVSSNGGCVKTKTLDISIGKPKFNMNPPDTVCLKQTILLNNSSLASGYEWTFGNGSSQNASSQKNPALHYVSSGQKTIELKLFNGMCSADTSFQIYVERPNPDFSFFPEISCEDPVEIALEASDQSNVNFNWATTAQNVTIDPGANTSFLYFDKERDSLYWNDFDKILINLMVTTEFGCTSDTTKEFYLKKPNAHFIPDVAQGCAPLEVTFSDLSESSEDIILWQFDYGDGQFVDLGSAMDHTHIYEEPGEYYTKLIIENEDGCRDTSAGEWILVGEHIEPDFSVDKTEICLGDTVAVEFHNEDPRIDGFHLDTDDGRFSQCWASNTANHVFETLPGTYDVTGSVDYNGCYTDKISSYQITVRGAKADIDYQLNCQNPYELQLSSNSTNATSLEWTVDGQNFQDSLAFKYLFSQTGDYQVQLTVKDDNAACPESTDFQEIFIRDVKAEFSVPEKVCDNLMYTLDASASVDVDNDCNQGYLWYIPTRRPWEHPYDTINTPFPKGKHLVTLVVEDINGCRDTSSRQVTSYGIDPEFSIAEEEFCLPFETQIFNTTQSDTTITSWSWSNPGLVGKEPVLDLDKTEIEKYTLSLYVEDALGCLDTTTVKWDIYEPESAIFLDPGRNLCAGDILEFHADDFTEKGSSLNFDWDFGLLGHFNQKDNALQITERGTYPLTLYFEEKDTGCHDSISTTIYVVDYPVADFISDVDSLDPICHPRIVTLNSTSVFDSLGYIQWTIGDLALSNQTNPTQTIELPKGENEIFLEAISFFGCSDTTSRTIELVGPEGEVELDKSVICLGDPIEFKLVNMVDVNEFEWDFGDGNTILNMNPVNYTYDRDVEEFDAKVILKSTENNCEYTIDIPLNIFDITADFDEIPELLLCPGEVMLLNQSENADQFEWLVPQGEILSETTDTVDIQFPDKGEYEVTLIASSSENHCMDEITKTVEVDELEEFYVVPNMFTPNNDGENDLFRPVITDENTNYELTLLTFKVYNRWGNLVYDNDRQKDGWDGYFNNQEAPAGVYGYYLEMDVNGCITLSNKGSVTLVR